MFVNRNPASVTKRAVDLRTGSATLAPKISTPTKESTNPPRTGWDHEAGKRRTEAEGICRRDASESKGPWSREKRCSGRQGGKSGFQYNRFPRSKGTGR